MKDWKCLLRLMKTSLAYLMSLLLVGASRGQTALRPSASSQKPPHLPIHKLASRNFGPDAPWFLANIPFLEIDDKAIQDTYYYRWKLYRSHIREIGADGTTVLEFLDNVPWARQPDTDLNDSASFHLREGRWLRDPRVVDDLIEHLYQGGANDRHFSESIADATESTTLVTGDPAPGEQQLDAMERIFDAWNDHFDANRNLYWIEPLLDATEYTISSIDASGAGFTTKPSTDQNKNGFTRGFAFRPSINSYQYANALAIAHFAEVAGRSSVAEEYRARASKIRSALLAQLWNPNLDQFTDRYQRTTPFVTAGDFIRGRELVGYVPWMYELPPREASSTNYASAWKHALAPTELGGAHGLRTVEPSYPRYLTQYRYDAPTGKPECQWNGPSWPFQTSQALTALANLLNDYSPASVTREDYLRLLRQYTQQHFDTQGKPDLQEDYDPDTGKPIVGLARSHHYNHSTYIDLILNGLIGIRPRADDILEVNPLVPGPTTQDAAPIRFFAIEGVAYHGHRIDIFYDDDGKRYHIGRGLSLFIDDQSVSGPGPLRRIEVQLPANSMTTASARRVDLAVNPGIATGPRAIASSQLAGAPASEAIDGRLWFFAENANGWSPAKDDRHPGFTLDFREARTVGSLELAFFSDGKTVQVPRSYRLQFKSAEGWNDVPRQHSLPSTPLANGITRIHFTAIQTQELRLFFASPPSPATFRLIEIKAFAN
jgi:hypothetical protein